MLKRLWLAALLLFSAAAPALAAQGNTVLPTTGTISGLEEQELINAALDAAVSGSIGGAAPHNATGGAAVQGQLWWDTSVASAMTLRIFDGASWNAILTVNTASHTVSIPNASLANPSITIAGHSVSLGGSQALQASDLSNGVTGTGAVVLAASPALTGAPTAPTPATSDNSNTIATTAFVKAAGGAQGIPGFSGLTIHESFSGTQARVQANYALLLNSTGGSAGLSNVEVYADLTLSGAGGIDTGSVQPNTWYALYLIYNGSSVAALYSLNFSAPTLPPGYTYVGRVGSALTDGNDHLWPVYQVGSRAQYVVQSAGTLTTTRRLSSGVQNGQVTVSGFVPPTAVRVQGAIFVAQSAVAYVYPNTIYGNFDYQGVGAQTNSGNSGTFPFDFVFEGGVQQIAWVSNAPTNFLEIFGWTDDVNAN